MRKSRPPAKERFSLPHRIHVKSKFDLKISIVIFCDKILYCEYHLIKLELQKIFIMDKKHREPIKPNFEIAKFNLHLIAKKKLKIKNQNFCKRTNPTTHNLILPPHHPNLFIHLFF
jgi:hypothetical protein